MGKGQGKRQTNRKNRLFQFGGFFAAPGKKSTIRSNYVLFPRHIQANLKE